MSLLLTSGASALSPGLTTSFLAVGGTGPYTYSVEAGGAGGTIDADGTYHAPQNLPTNPKTSSDVIKVVDSTAAMATLPILITNPLGLFCEILQSELGLEQGRVYLWDQKIMQPTDSGLYIAVAVMQTKAFGNNISFLPDGRALQSINVQATLSLDIISRGNEALMRKEEVLLALRSMYSEAQQEANSFFIGSIQQGGQFVNLSFVDGAAIPYRFNLSVNIQYFVKKVKEVPFFEDFEPPQVTTES